MSGGPLDALLRSMGLQPLGEPASGPVPLAGEAGFFHPSLPRSLQIIGCAAVAGSDTNPWASALPRAIVVTPEASAADWSQQAARFGVPVYRSEWSSPVTVDRLRTALNTRTAPRQLLHATLVRVLDLGVLLQGASGSGKSELALDLVSRGHALVADDAVEVVRPAAACLTGECSPALRGYIEVRGLGILDVRACYGDDAVADRTRIDLSIRIDDAGSTGAPMDRVHGRRQTLELLGVALPEILLPARLGHNAVMVEAACRDHWLRLNGYVASEAFVAEHDRRLAGVAAPGGEP